MSDPPPRIRVVNPNSNEDVTRGLDAALEPLRFANGPEIVCSTLAEGPFGIESQRDGITWETHDGVECVDVHIKAMLDDRGRIMIIACHNVDNGDGWEREGENDYFFHEFSEKRAFPLGINIIFYVMTH